MLLCVPADPHSALSLMSSSYYVLTSCFVGRFRLAFHSHIFGDQRAGILNLDRFLFAGDFQSLAWPTCTCSRRSSSSGALTATVVTTPLHHKTLRMTRHTTGSMMTGTAMPSDMTADSRRHTAIGGRDARSRHQATTTQRGMLANRKTHRATEAAASTDTDTA